MSPPLRLCIARPLVLLLLLLLGAGCYTVPQEAAREGARPAYAEATPFYQDFDRADDLAAYLDPERGAGPLVSAHRGGPAPGYPENALPTFERVLRAGPALLEVDVRKSRDGVLVLMHDETLERTTTGRGPVGARSLIELRTLLLTDNAGAITPFRIPTLAEALAWAEGRGLLLLDIKPDVAPGEVVRLLKAMDAADQVVVIAYTLDDLRTYHRLAPELMLSASADTEEEARAILYSGIDRSRLVLFAGVGQPDPAVLDLAAQLGVRTSAATFGAIDEAAARRGPSVYREYAAQGVGLVATDAPVSALRALRDSD